MEWRRLLLSILCVFGMAGTVFSQDMLTDFPVEVRQWFRNPDGSCVQCSIGMCGVWQNVPQATTLLWNSDYGPAVRGGSYPSRVEKYCDARKIPAYNVTGSDTWDWMKWAAKTRRMAAIGCFRAHFQTLVWYEPGHDRPWCVCNNNSPSRIDRYTESEFRRHHLASGQWVVILKTPPPPVKPKYTQWW